MGLVGMRTNIILLLSRVYYSEELILFIFLLPSFPPSLPPYLCISVMPSIVIREDKVLEYSEAAVSYMIIYVGQWSVGGQESSLHVILIQVGITKRGATVNILIITHTHFTIMFYLSSYHAILTSSSKHLNLLVCTVPVALPFLHLQLDHNYALLNTTASTCTACSNT